MLWTSEIQFVIKDFKFLKLNLLKYFYFLNKVVIFRSCFLGDHFPVNCIDNLKYLSRNRSSKDDPTNNTSSDCGSRLDSTSKDDPTNTLPDCPRSSQHSTCGLYSPSHTSGVDNSQLVELWRSMIPPVLCLAPVGKHQSLTTTPVCNLFVYCRLELM